MRMIDLAELDSWSARNSVCESTYIKPASSYLDEVIEYFHSKAKDEGKNLPWHKFNGRFDIRPHEVTLWMGYSGHGKSLALSQVMMALMAKGEKCLIASLEMRPSATMARMGRMASGGAKPTVEAIKRFHEWTDERLWIYDQHGSVSPERIHNLCRYAQSELGVKHIVVDSLMKIVRDEKDAAIAKDFVDGLCVIARDTGLHIHLVHHSRKGEDESSVPGKHDARGTSSITDLVDNCVIVWKNKPKQEAIASGNKPKYDFDALIKVDKQRHAEGWEGAVGLWFHEGSNQFISSPGIGPMEFGIYGGKW